MLNLITIPDPTDFLASTTEWSSPIFTEFLPIIYLAVGLAIGIGIVMMIIRWASSFFHKN